MRVRRFSRSAVEERRVQLLRLGNGREKAKRTLPRQSDVPPSSFIGWSDPPPHLLLAHVSSSRLSCLPPLHLGLQCPLHVAHLGPFPPRIDPPISTSPLASLTCDPTLSPLEQPTTVASRARPPTVVSVPSPSASSQPPTEMRRKVFVSPHDADVAPSPTISGSRALLEGQATVDAETTEVGEGV